MPMERRSNLQFALGRCLDPALHRWFTYRDRRLVALLSVESLSAQFTTSHRRSADTILRLAGVAGSLND
ncbi:hypothetical protein HAX54_047690, partial [Datura stramonium]|nr:hypothetical protein [Datura stramonium]